jgi:excisionase family DNA binding protein
MAQKPENNAFADGMSTPGLGFGGGNKMLTAQELAVYLRVNRSTVYRLLKRGELPGFRIGSEWRFHVDEINRWFKQRGGVVA